MITEELYHCGNYLRNNPDWHVSAAPWKTQGILKILQRNRLMPHTICEIGCGAGEILLLLQQHLPEDCTFEGYDIAPQAIELARERENPRLRVHLADFLTASETQEVYFDVILLIGVLEHFENCFHALREIKPKSQYKIFQIPLDISVKNVLRNRLIDFYYNFGHLHFFTKDIVLQTLREAGYEILDTFYTLPPLDTSPWSPKPWPLARKLLRLTKGGLERLPASLLYCMHHDLAVRVFGGWQLMVLAR